MDRRSEIAANLEAVQQRVASALDSAGRDDESTLIVVTKFFPASDVVTLAGLGVRDVGENRDQEASPKAAQAAEEAGEPPVESLRWHFVGQLQSNKAKSVVRYATAIHSIDRRSLVKALDKAMANEQLRRAGAGADPRDSLQCFIQVNLDEGNGQRERADGAQWAQPAQDAGRTQETSRSIDRGGASPADVLELAGMVEDAEHLQLAGVMAVAPLGQDPGQAFERLASISAQLCRKYPHADRISAGMSSDLEQAIGHGATHLRVGSNVLGQRPDLR